MKRFPLWFVICSIQLSPCILLRSWLFNSILSQSARKDCLKNPLSNSGVYRICVWESNYFPSVHSFWSRFFIIGELSSWETRGGTPSYSPPPHTPSLLLYLQGLRWYTEKTSIPFPFKLNGIWSWWQFSFRFWTKWSYIWFKIESKSGTTIISHSMWKEMEI